MQLAAGPPGTWRSLCARLGTQAAQHPAAGERSFCTAAAMEHCRCNPGKEEVHGSGAASSL